MAGPVDAKTKERIVDAFVKIYGFAPEKAEKEAEFYMTGVAQGACKDAKGGGYAEGSEAYDACVDWFVGEGNVVTDKEGFQRFRNLSDAATFPKRELIQTYLDKLKNGNSFIRVSSKTLDVANSPDAFVSGRAALSSDARSAVAALRAGTPAEQLAALQVKANASEKTLLDSLLAARLAAQTAQLPGATPTQQADASLKISASVGIAADLVLVYSSIKSVAEKAGNKDLAAYAESRKAVLGKTSTDGTVFKHLEAATIASGADKNDFKTADAELEAAYKALGSDSGVKTTAAPVSTYNADIQAAFASLSAMQTSFNNANKAAGDKGDAAKIQSDLGLIFTNLQQFKTGLEKASKSANAEQKKHIDALLAILGDETKAGTALHKSKSLADMKTDTPNYQAKVVIGLEELAAILTTMMSDIKALKPAKAAPSGGAGESGAEAASDGKAKKPTAGKGLPKL